jgi:hypothetical protein
MPAFTGSCCALRQTKDIEWGPLIERFHNSTARDNDLLHTSTTAASTGMIGFDIACKTARSGSRMQGYLVNATCKQ